jgi:signal transduction histidine kinase
MGLNDTVPSIGEPGNANANAVLPSHDHTDATPFVERLSEEEREALFSSGCKECHSEGSVICREGEPGDILYVIRKGQVAVLKEVGDGEHTVLGYRGTGEILGEMSLLTQQPRTASLIAADDTVLMCVSASDFTRLMERYPGISKAILRVLSDRLQAADVARTSTFYEEKALAQRLEQASGEATRLGELARVRQETIELVAHDLRTPLTVIDGCIQLLRSSLPNASETPASDIMDLAERSSSKLMDLLEDLLNAARRDVPAVIPARESVDLGGLVELATESAKVSAHGTGIRFDLQVEPGLARPLADGAQLERVVGNLLDNAVSYTPAGGSIGIEAAMDGEEIRVSVTDTGPGVPEEHRKLIFERFSRVPSTRGRKQGFGLGLAYCRQVIEAHSGRIWVEDNPSGEGSRFIFTLPSEDTTEEK